MIIIVDKKPIAEKPGFRYLVRIRNTDIDGSKAIFKALQKIKGISFMFSNAILKTAGINPVKKSGELTDNEVNRIDEIVRNPLKYNIPIWMLNRRKDADTGDDKHLTSTDVKFEMENDIKMMKKIRSYKGWRHNFGLTVRGQSTKSHFRKNKGKASLGVIKKKPEPKKDNKD